MQERAGFVCGQASHARPIEFMKGIEVKLNGKNKNQQTRRAAKENRSGEAL